MTQISADSDAEREQLQRLWSQGVICASLAISGHPETADRWPLSWLNQPGTAV